MLARTGNGPSLGDCMRSMRGAREFCLIRSYLQTASKHGSCWLEARADAMRGIPWMPTTATI